MNTDVLGFRAHLIEKGDAWDIGFHYLCSSSLICVYLCLIFLSLSHSACMPGMNNVGLSAKSGAFLWFDGAFVAFAGRVARP
jgi:hypothetical protein